MPSGHAALGSYKLPHRLSVGDRCMLPDLVAGWPIIWVLLDAAVDEVPQLSGAFIRDTGEDADRQTDQMTSQLDRWNYLAQHMQVDRRT
jgi:hypothetical protein